MGGGGRSWRTKISIKVNESGKLAPFFLLLSERISLRAILAEGGCDFFANYVRIPTSFQVRSLALWMQVQG